MLLPAGLAVRAPARLQSATSAPTGVRRQCAEAGNQLRQVRGMHRACLQVKQHMPGREDLQRVRTDLTPEVSGPTPKGQKPHRRGSCTEHLIARGEDASPHSLLLSQMTRAGLALGTLSPLRKAKRYATGVQCSSEPPQPYARRSREGGLNGHRSSKPSLSISVEGEPERRQERQHRSSHSVLHQGSRDSQGSRAEAMTDRSGSAGKDVLAELRMRALAAMKAHREHL